MQNEFSVQLAIKEILAELQCAKVHGSEFASLHEAYAVMLEELDEVWEITKQKKKDRDPAHLQKEQFKA
jgi:hypothetical protein